MHDKQGALRVLLAEVNNTFGQRHLYVLTAPGLAVIKENSILECQKEFHVSPFCNVEGLYRFKSSSHGTQERMAIDYFDQIEEIQPLLKTAIVVQAQVFSTQALLLSLLSMPMMTVGVMSGFI